MGAVILTLTIDDCRLTIETLPAEAEIRNRQSAIGHHQSAMT
jgi:hypothetical protein